MAFTDSQQAFQLPPKDVDRWSTQDVPHLLPYDSYNTFVDPDWISRRKWMDKAIRKGKYEEVTHSLQAQSNTAAADKSALCEGERESA